MTLRSLFVRAKAKSSPEPTFGGWREADIDFLAKKLIKERPHLGFDVTGIRHMITFDGQGFASRVSSAIAQQEMYSKWALAFDEPPVSASRLLLASHEHEVVGFMEYPRTRMRSAFSVGVNDKITEGDLGWLYFSGDDQNHETGAYQPLVQATFEVQSVEQQIEIRQTLQAALSGHGSAFISIRLSPVENADEWIKSFRKDGYSPSVKISGAYFTSNVGKTPFTD